MSASNHAATYNRLRPLLKPAKRVSKPPQSAETSVKAIQGILHIDSQKRNAKYPDNVKEVLNGNYSDENEFDIALFKALQKDLGAMGLPITFSEIYGERTDTTETLPNKIIIDILDCDNDNYAFGIACQARVNTNGPHSSNKIVSPTQDSKASKQSQSDHACCVFKKQNNGNWKIEGMLSVVELKMSNTSSKCETDFLNKPDPIIQPICYVLEHVWPDICKFGLVERQMESIPVALIAAKKSCEEKESVEAKESSGTKRKKGGDAKNPRMRVVKGSLLLPSQWGHAFSVQSNYTEPFPESHSVQMKVDDTNTERDHATNLYMETILEGIKLLAKCCKNMKDNKEKGKIQFPSPLSGLPPESLLPGCSAEETIPMYDHCGSPMLSSAEFKRSFQQEGKHKYDVLGKSPSGEELKQFKHEKSQKYFITQGDLYHFEKLNLSKMSDSGRRSRWFAEEDEVHDVFVKVWSPTVHRGMQNPLEYMSVCPDIVLTRDKRNEPTVLEISLSEVLIGLVEIRKPPATLTITREIFGVAVKPSELKDQVGEDLAGYKSKLTAYWNLFENLCKDILVPLAKIGIIHQDLRPGYDCTYNIMIGTTAKDKTIKMRLIDYESLCFAEAYTKPEDDHRYPEMELIEGRINAYDILFQQCVGIAYAWIKEVGAGDENMSFPEALDWFGETLKLELSRDGDGEVNNAIEWWKSVMKEPKNAFYELLRKIGKIFDVEHDTNPLKKQKTGLASANTAATATTAATTPDTNCTKSKSVR